MRHITLGSDPELFLVQGTKFVSSIGLIGGSKEFPRSIREDGCAVQEDNVAVEFNIPPSDTVERFIEGIKFNLDYLVAHAKTMGMDIAIVPSAVFSDDELSSPAAQQFGCEPDYNAWTKQINPRPKASNPNLRSAGGHVHFGSKELGLDPWKVGRAADLFLGVPSLEFDADTGRRELYGKAGAVRIKPYGVEYRTLSNFWIKSEDLMRWVWGQAEKAVEFVKAGNDLTAEEGRRIQHCINTSDVGLMTQLRRHYGV